MDGMESPVKYPSGLSGRDFLLSDRRPGRIDLFLQEIVCLWRKSSKRACRKIKEYRPILPDMNKNTIYLTADLGNCTKRARFFSTGPSLTVFSGRSIIEKNNLEGQTKKPAAHGAQGGTQRRGRRWKSAGRSPQKRRDADRRISAGRRSVSLFRCRSALHGG